MKNPHNFIISFFTQSSQIPSSQVQIFVYSENMKISKILLAALCVSVISPLFGQDTTTDKELFEFSATAPAVEAKIPTTEVKVEVKVEPKVVPKTEVKVEPKPAPTATLVADAQTLIKDKLVQKYQVRLDDVIGRMTNRLGTASVSEQRAALTDLRDRMTEKKTLVTGMKDLEPLKQDIITAILDHVIFRLDGLIKQSAHTVSDKQQA